MDAQPDPRDPHGCTWRVAGWNGQDWAGWALNGGPPPCGWGPGVEEVQEGPPATAPFLCGHRLLVDEDSLSEHSSDDDLVTDDEGMGASSHSKPHSLQLNTLWLKRYILSCPVI